MSAFVISLVVVCAAVVITIRVVQKHEAELDQPATPRPERDRENVVQTALPLPVAWGERAIAPSPFRRVRSALFLIVILTVLGALTALLVAVGGAILVSGLRNAVE